MRISTLMILLMVIGGLADVEPVDAGHRRAHRAVHGPVPAPCHVLHPHGAAVVPKYVEKTILVPTWVTEKRKVWTIEYTTEKRTRTYTVHRCVPETKDVEKTFTVIIPEPKTKTVEYTSYVPHYEEVTKRYQVRTPVYKTVEKEVTVQVPHYEIRQGERTVCRPTPVKQQRVVCRDRGHWESRACESTCHVCGGCGCRRCGGAGSYKHVRKVWIPKIVKEEIEVTVYRHKCFVEPYEYRACVYKPVTKTCKVRVCEFKTQERTCVYRVCRPKPVKKTRQVHYTEYRAEKQTKTVPVTTYKTIAEKKTATFHVCIPKKVEREVDVRVCKMVPKKVAVPVYPGCDRRHGP